MTGIVAFDNDPYISAQSRFIRARMKRFDGRLYLEFGDSLLSAFHAARVLPGCDPNVEIRLLKELECDGEILFCIREGAIERRTIHSCDGIAYDVDAMKLRDDLVESELSVFAVAVTRWEGRSSTLAFETKLENRGVRVYTYAPTKGCPTDIDRDVSGEGYGANPRIGTTKSLVVETGPGPGSVKMATCLPQVRRYLRCASEYMTGLADKAFLEKADLLFKERGIGPEYHRVVPAARRAEAGRRAAEDTRPVLGRRLRRGQGRTHGSRRGLLRSGARTVFGRDRHG
jgi:uncharacterized protein (UPF0371 family)